MMKSIITLLLILFIALPLMAAKKDWVTAKNTPISLEDKDVVPLGSKDIERKKPVTLSPGMKMGTTWFEYQHNSNISKQIALDSNGEVHVFWTNGLDSGASNRHVFYNATCLSDSVGFQIESDARAGFITGDLLSDDRAVAAFHTRLLTWPATDWGTAVGVDLISCLGAFSREIVDTITRPRTETETVIWPHMAVDANDNIHVVSSQIETNAGDPRPIWYNRSTDQGISFSSWVMVDDSLRAVSYEVQTSRNSGRVCIAYTRGVPFNPSQINADVHYNESMDYGATWNFPNNSINVTNFSPSDTLRAFVDVSAIYDNNDSLHLAFTLQNVEGDSLFFFASLIAHWSKETGVTIVNSDTLIGWHSQYAAGDFKRMADRPSLGIDPATGFLYCVFTANPPGDTSAAAYPNGELFVSCSEDGGLNWSPATNLTNTPTPGCTPGNCDDDDYPSLAEIVNDTLHIVYINDLDAGGAVRPEGSWTLNPVRYLKVPASTLPCQVGVEEEKDRVNPKSFTLSQNVPNPFEKGTTISYTLPKKSNVSLKVYDITGREVVRLLKGEMDAGYHTLRWDGKDETGKEVSSGIYFYRVKSRIGQASEFTKARKMVVLR
jgi:hypothetical protein